MRIIAIPFILLSFLAVVAVHGASPTVQSPGGRISFCPTAASSDCMTFTPKVIAETYANGNVIYGTHRYFASIEFAHNSTTPYDTFTCSFSNGATLAVLIEPLSDGTGTVLHVTIRNWYFSTSTNRLKYSLAVDHGTWHNASQPVGIPTIQLPTFALLDGKINHNVEWDRVLQYNGDNGEPMAEASLIFPSFSEYLHFQLGVFHDVVSPSGDGIGNNATLTSDATTLDPLMAYLISCVVALAVFLACVW